MAQKNKKVSKKKTSTKKKTAAVDGTVKVSADAYGREVRHFIQNGKHHVSHHRNGTDHPVECDDHKHANAVFKEECDSHE